MKVKYSIFVPSSIDIPVKKIDLTELSKKDIIDTIKSTLDDKVYDNKQFTYYKQNDEMYIVSFKDRIPETPKGTKYLVPIYSIFKTYTKNHNDIIYIIASSKYKVISVFIGNEIQTYDITLDNQTLIEFIHIKQRTLENNYPNKKIKIFLDIEVDSIESDEVDFDNQDISLLEKTEILENKSTIELMLEKVNIRIKFDLSLKSIFNTFVYSILYVVIGYLFYQNYELNNKLDTFYNKIEENTDKHLNNLNQRYIQELENKIRENKNADVISEQLQKTLNNIEIKFNNGFDMKQLDERFKFLEKKIDNIKINPEVLENVSKTTSTISKPKETNTNKIINYKILIKSDNYIKIQLDNKIVSLKNTEQIDFDDNISILYIDNVLKVNNSFINLDITEGSLNLK